MESTVDGEKIFNPFLTDRPLVKDKEYDGKNIDAREIIKPKIDENFWNHHGYSKEKYIAFAKDYMEAKVLLEKGEKLEPNSKLSMSYANYTSKDEPIKLIEFNDHYMVDGAGRHRVALAQMFNIPIEAKITKYKASKDINKNNTKKIEISQSSESALFKSKQKYKSFFEATSFVDNLLLLTSFTVGFITGDSQLIQDKGHDMLEGYMIEKTEEYIKENYINNY